jgi:hypothetical protein
MIEEIEQVRRDYGLETAVFQDDTFILDKAWLEEWTWKWSGKPYTCNVRANLVTDDICRMLVKSGCVGVNWSIESGSPRLRNEVLKRNMTDSQIYNCAKLLNQYGIKHRVASMIGLPTETLTERNDTLMMASRLGADYAFCNTFVPYEGTDITKYAIEQGCYDGGKIPDTFYEPSCLNFWDKAEILKTALLWSGLAKGRTWLKMFPLWFARLYWTVMDKVNMARLYRVRVKDVVNMIRGGQ